jgi:site-specific DNA-methyltransferase (adenine-specific)
MTYQILKGNSLDLLPTLADNSIDAIVTDPPYELGFMGKTWDNSGIAYSLELWQQCLRVLKPGGHLLAFSGSRTYHRMVVSIEDAGFEIRDMISWISNKTFPKSLNIGKAIDKAAGAERDRVPTNEGIASGAGNFGGGNSNQLRNGTKQSDKALTEDAKKWNGWGTGLKPTVEPIVMARKPVEGTVANNVLTYGTGGLNIDASRIGTESVTINTFDNGAKPFGDAVGEPYTSKQSQGRWPANLILDEQAAMLVDEQSGTSKSPKTYVRGVGTLEGERVAYANIGEVAGTESKNYGDTGGASRFFYVAKASKRDRNEGLEDLPDHEWRDDGAAIPQRNDRPFLPSKNHHPTVKPTELMQYLVKLITPPGGTVLDPFTGSGSTGKAAILEGFDFIGIELTEDYWPIIEGRLKHAEAKVAERIKETSDQEQEKLF